MIFQGIKNIWHFFQAVLANLFFGFPTRKLKVIGVTGTNGKTTTAQMITKILEEAGKKTALASTINFKIGEKEWINETKFTTLSAFKIQKFAREALADGCEYLVLEVSSHALDQNRVWGIDFEIAIITNITREHLDYHKTMKAYRRAKRKLFGQAKKIVVNLDMENPEEFFTEGVKDVWAYAIRKESANNEIGKKKLNLRIVNAREIELETGCSRYNVSVLPVNSLGIEFRLNLPGKFNIENALAATSAGLAENINLEKIKTALEKIKNIPGRMEMIPNSRGLNIFVDYAVTPDSLEKLYSLILTAREKLEISSGGKLKIISVFGACGERDRGKRPIMGEIVSRAADYVILTNEDPYGEDPERIIQEVAFGVKNKKENENFWRITDRREALKKALLLAESGDFVVVTGKGAETSMAVGAKRIPWNDRKVIQEIL